MSRQNAHYPTIMKLKTVEFGMNLLLNAYDIAHKTYIQNISDGDRVTAAKNLAELQQINESLLTEASKGKKLLDKAINEGGIDQKIIAIQKPKLEQIIRQANAQDIINKRHMKELMDAEGNLEVTELSQKSNKLQYVILLVVGIIVAGLTVKTITSKNVSMLDNAILAIVVGLIIYALIKKLI